MWGIKPLLPKIDWNNPLTSGLKFDDPLYLGTGNTVDLVNNNTGTLSGATPPSWLYDASATGLGRGLSFNGTTGFVSYPEISAYDLTTSAISIEVWVRWSSTIGQLLAKPHAIGAHTSPYFSYALMGISTTSARMWLVTSGGTFNTLDGALSLTDGVLYHIVGTYDNSNLRIYQDTVLKNTTATGAGTITSYATNLQLGANGAPGEYFGGKMFLARVWNRQLSAGEIGQLYQNPFRIYYQSNFFPFFRP